MAPLQDAADAEESEQSEQSNQQPDWITLWLCGCASICFCGVGGRKGNMKMRWLADSLMWVLTDEDEGSWTKQMRR